MKDLPEQNKSASADAPSVNHHSYVADDDEYENYTSVGVDGLLSASEKLLAINRGVAETDERDASYNDRIYSIDRLMAERVKLDQGRSLRSLMGRLSRARSLNPMSVEAFKAYTNDYINGNPLAPVAEEINPLQLMEQRRRATKMGPGGVGDPNAITLAMQGVHSSQFGFIDPISGPESEKAGVDIRLASGTKIGSNGLVHQLVLDRKTGKKRWVTPVDLLGKTLKLPD